MPKWKKGEAAADCPECGASVDLKETAKIGTKVDWPKCGERLEITALEPPELYYAYAEWEDGFEGDEEEEDKEEDEEEDV